ncbi:AAA family ATPase [Streptomyces sp. NPDC007162]|uniref:AAA family ATPase n=1 Tax=Streptomyces sp. NPDC007162 TaxID=3156917 RepID=UPI0033C65747
MGGPSGVQMVRGGTAARLVRSCLTSRRSELDAVLGSVRDPVDRRPVLVRGERGAGRTALVRTAAEQLSGEGVVVIFLPCVPGDAEHPLLLTLRMVTALEEHRARTAGWRPSGTPAADVLSAVEQGDRAAVRESLAAALAQPVPVVVVVDDVHLADSASIAGLGRVRTERGAGGARLVLTAVDHGPVGGSSGSGRAVDRLARNRTVLTVSLARLGPEDVTAAVSQQLQAVPDRRLSELAYSLSRGIPGAVDALLTGWAEQGAIRVVDGHGYLDSTAPVPVLPDDDRFIAALDALGEPHRTAAAVLSILWPLGRAAVELGAAASGLSDANIEAGIRPLTDAGIVDELPSHDADGPARGWRFRIPLVEHAVRERLGPLERRRLSAAAVEALWAAGETAHTAALLVEEADAVWYLPDRIADAGTLLDRRRAATELVAAADRLHPAPGTQAIARWLGTAALLTDQPSARDLALFQYAKVSYLNGDYAASTAQTEAILRNPGEGLGVLDLQETGVLAVSAAAADDNWERVSRMAEQRWWDDLPLPAFTEVAGRTIALCLLERWPEALALLDRTEAVWNTDPAYRFHPELCRAACEYVMGRPERFLRSLDAPVLDGLPPERVYSMTVMQLDHLLGTGDLRRAEDLLSARGMTSEVLWATSRFLLCHLQGRWNEAMETACSALAHDRTFDAAPNQHLLAARTAAILLARGRTTSASRLLDSVRGRKPGPLEHTLDHCEAEVLRALGELDQAAGILRRGLEAANERQCVYATDELWATLAVVSQEAGRHADASACLSRLHTLAERMGSGQSRLLYLLASARVLGGDPAEDVRDRLREAVDLARSRSQPFETGITLATAAIAGAGPKTLLYEAYELFGETGAALWRYRARAALRDAGLAVPGRKQATTENDHLLATLIAEGLTNRQVATVLRLSENAVAHRITRLFTRTGLRSRTKVATAVLTAAR